MNWTKFPGYNTTYGAPKSWDPGDCGTLECMVGSFRLPSGKFSPYVDSRWMPTPEELVLLNAGHPITMRQCFDGMVPTSLWVDPTSPVELQEGQDFTKELGALVQKHYGVKSTKDICAMLMSYVNEWACGREPKQIKPLLETNAEILTGNGEGTALPSGIAHQLADGTGTVNTNGKFERWPQQPIENTYNADGTVKSINGRTIER